MTVKLRSEKGSALTRGELDGNFLEVRRSEIAFAFMVQCEANEIVWAYAVTRPMSIDLANSVGNAPINVSSSFVLSLNGQPVGNVNIVTGAVSFVGTIPDVDAGDLLSLVASEAVTFDVIAITILAAKL